MPLGLYRHSKQPDQGSLFSLSPMPSLFRKLGAFWVRLPDASGL